MLHENRRVLPIHVKHSPPPVPIVGKTIGKRGAGAAFMPSAPLPIAKGEEESSAADAGKNQD